MQQVAQVSCARRNLLLRVHAFRLRREDLEDCYGQATLELLADAGRRGSVYASRAHLANTLEQRFLSRVHDRRRALAGRSPMEAALASAVPIDGAPEADLGIADAQTDVERLVLAREELSRINQLALLLTTEQRLVLRSQVSLEMDCRTFCAHFGWSP
jgi:hypothetical protein